MYFVFEQNMMTWHRQTVTATPLNDPNNRELRWWDTHPFLTSLPSLIFSVNPKAPAIDNYFTGNMMCLYSTKLIDLIQAAGVVFETSPAVLLDKKTQQPLARSYGVFHLLEKYPAIDAAKSDMGVKSNPQEDTNAASVADWKAHKTIRKLVLTEAALQAQRQLFCIEGREVIVLIHQDLKAALENAGISGCLYTPVADYRFSYFPYT